MSSLTTTTVRTSISPSVDDDDYVAYLHWARNEAGIEASKVCVKGKDKKEDDGQEILDKKNGGHDDDNDDHSPQRRRGMYAMDTIYPGERIIFIPARALLGNHMLRQMGQRALRVMLHQQQQGGEEEEEEEQQQHEQQSVRSLECHPTSSRSGNHSTTISREYLEQMSMGMIEEIRQSLLLNPLETTTTTTDSTTTSDVAAVAAVVRQAAINVGYQWREDDGVAIYLAVAQYINRRNDDFVSDEDADASGGGGGGDVTGREQQEASSKQKHAAVVAPTVLVDGLSDHHPLLLATPVAPAIPLQSDESHGSDDATFSSPNSIERGEQVEHVQAVAVVTTTDENQKQNETSILHHPPPIISFLPHVQILPVSFGTSPMYYSENELARIEGTNCHGYSVRMKEQIQRDWMQLHYILQAYSQHYRRQEQADNDATLSFSCQHLIAQLDLSQIVNLEAYKWALCNVYSRSSDFQIIATTTTTTTAGLLESSPSGASSMLRVIAPLFDMMNHEFKSDLSHAMDQDGNISVFNGSQKAIQPGEEICLCYGNFGNEKLLFIYGFTVPENPFDVVSIYAPIQPSDPLYQVKARILQTKCGISDTNAISHSLCMSHLRQGKSILPDLLLSVLRVVGIQTTDEILALAQPDDEDGDSEPAASRQLAMISESNERGALVALHHALDSMSRRLALNLISDEGLQASSSYPLPLETVIEEGTTDREANDEPSLRVETAQILASADVSQVADANAQNANNLCQSELTILIAAISEVTERLHALDGLSGDQQ